MMDSFQEIYGSGPAHCAMQNLIMQVVMMSTERGWSVRGLVPLHTYAYHCFCLEPSSCKSLLFYSGGLVEAYNSRREMFGFPRLKTVLEEHSAGISLIDLLLDELKRFTGEGWEEERVACLG